MLHCSGLVVDRTRTCSGSFRYFQKFGSSKVGYRRKEKPQGSRGLQVDWVEVWPMFGLILAWLCSKFGLFGDVRFFGGKAKEVKKFDQCKFVRFEVWYFWVRSSTTSGLLAKSTFFARARPHHHIVHEPSQHAVKFQYLMAKVFVRCRDTYSIIFRLSITVTWYRRGETKEKSFNKNGKQWVRLLQHAADQVIKGFLSSSSNAISASFLPPSIRL